MLINKKRSRQEYPYSTEVAHANSASINFLLKPQVKPMLAPSIVLTNSKTKLLPSPNSPISQRFSPSGEQLEHRKLAHEL